MSSQLDQDPRDKARDSFLKILKILYSRDLLDRIALESQLDELCWYFDTNLMPGDLQVQRSPRRFPIVDPDEYNKFLEGING